MKKIVIVLIVLLAIIGISLGGLVIYYNVSLGPVDSKLANIDNENDLNDSDRVSFVIERMTPTRKVIDNLYEANLIRNKYSAYLYIKFHKDLNLQAGIYDLNRGMSLKEILNKFANGEVVENTVSITFIEGKRLTNYVKQISNTFPYPEDEVLEVISDKEYLQELINKYWFLTDDILNDKLYYALEGYLYPDTYTFYEDASIKDVIEVLLNGTKNKLEPYKELFENNKYSVHELITLASIIELEGYGAKDKAGVAQVFYNRLNVGMSLGSDVTTYYGARVEMSERELYQTEIETKNDYNTRHVSMAGKLPVGPICNPSVESIDAVLEPDGRNDFYFVAGSDGRTLFATTYEGHIQNINQLKRDGLWYEYK